MKLFKQSSCEFFGICLAIVGIVGMAVSIIADKFENPFRNPTSIKMVEVKVLNVTGPAPLTVTIQELATGNIYENIQVSKRYSDWESIPTDFPFIVYKKTITYPKRNNLKETKWEELMSGLEWSKEFKKDNNPFD